MGVRPLRKSSTSFLRSARRADVEKADRCKLSHLKRHARSPFHLQQVAKFLQLPSPEPSFTAPPQAAFEGLYEQCCKGLR